MDLTYYIERMREATETYGEERSHIYADGALVQCLEALARHVGEGTYAQAMTVLDLYHSIDKWYA